MSSLRLPLLFFFVLLSIVYCQLFPSIDSFASLTTLKDTNLSDSKAVAHKSFDTAKKFIPFGNLLQLPGMGGAAAGGGASPAAPAGPAAGGLFGGLFG